MHPGMTHYPQANTPVRVPDIVNSMRDPGFLPRAWGQQLGVGNALYDAYQGQNMLQKLGVMPGIGDAAGFAGDLQSMYQNPEERTVPNALLAGAGLVPGIPAGLAGMTAWHGSPHLFDRFKMSQVGTGEGAQAYGHGLYLAENPGTAQWYADKLSGAEKYTGDMITPEGKMQWRDAFRKYHPDKEAVESAIRVIDRFDKRFGFNSSLDSVNDDLLPGMRVAMGLDKGDWSKFTMEAKDNAHLYKVDVPDEHVAKMLDWDKPLSEQPESVRNALNPLLENVSWTKNPWPESGYTLKRGNEFLLSRDRPQDIGELTGKTVYRLFTNAKTDKQASEYLNSLGIPGIRYLDATSRGAGEGTRNMVLFDESLANILERNGDVLAP